ncbi:NACHT, LRR and PYD domains-containing protein 14 [Gouania willdenowi]|uniref:NACHT, LRR and PYD domains-containing protein 14-like n=1 Tax=Gouania willdenowi TaxID=441366 RepID=A0A8C5G8S6_GOUWI|nr:NACHT, LRR and PYD domains-containing protein 14-like [Gouania willdenowi]XP_028308434.1 NACHT, LRR and PYD domains-containing protein 14-like [Gouania willdenowi]
MDKAAVLAHILKSGDEKPTLLGGEPPARVILHHKDFIHPLTTGAQGAEDLLLHHALHSTPSAEELKLVVLTGPEGSGKSTALEKLVLDWTRGEQLLNFTHVFYFRFRDINRVEDVMSLEIFLHLHHHHISPECVSLALQKPDDVLLVFDGLDEYKHSVDPSDYSLSSDPSGPASVSCLVASLLHGYLLKGATIVVSTRPTKVVKYLNGTELKVLGFHKRQRLDYFHRFFSDPDISEKALNHMETTLGFYDFSCAPRFCWTVCSVYKSLMDRGAELPETLTQLFVQILANLLNQLSLCQTSNIKLVLELGKMASDCYQRKSLSCNKMQMVSLGLQQVLSSADAFLRVDGEPDSDSCVFSFHCQLIRDLVLAVSFFLAKLKLEEEVEKFLQRHKDGAKFLDFFLSGLSEPVQRKPLETLLGEFSSDRITKFKLWFQSSSEIILKGYHKEQHYHCFHLLHQAQNQSLVQDIITPSARIGISYGGLSLQDCVALSYVIICLGETETLNLYSAGKVTEEMSQALLPALRSSSKIILSQSSLDSGAVQLLASALSTGLATELNLSYCCLGDEKLKILCSGLRDSKLHELNLQSCGLTEMCCEGLASALPSLSQLCVLNVRCNEIKDQGLTSLCKALQSPHCTLQELEMQMCNLTSASMEDLSAALCSGCSQLKRVNLTQNLVCDSGVEALCKALKSPFSKLRSLNLFDNELTSACCPFLKEALMSEHCSLSDLDLSVNTLGPEGSLLLCQALRRPDCPIEKLSLTRCELTLPVFEELGSVLKKENCPLKALNVGLNDVGDHGVKHLWDAVAHPSCMLEELDVEMTGLTDACIGDVCAAIKASKTLKRLELRNNSLTDASVPALVQVVQESHSMEEMNLKYNDFSEDVFEIMDECEKIRY